MSDQRALRDLEVAEAIEILGIVTLAADIRALASAVNQLKEQNMADFTNLNAAVDGLGAAVQRIDTDFQALKDQLANDATDQAAVDALTAKVQASIDAVSTVDPTPVTPPAA